LKRHYALQCAQVREVLNPITLSASFTFTCNGIANRFLPLVAAYQLNPRDRQSAFDLALAHKFGGEFVRAREQVEQMLKEGDLSKQDEANLRRLLGDLDETLGDPLGW